MKKRKKILPIILIFIGVIVILFVILLLKGGEVNFTTAKLTEVTTTSEIDSNTNIPFNNKNVFDIQSPIIYVAVTAENAPEGTIITAEWIYLDTDQLIVEVPHNMEAISENIVFSLTKPNNGFPTGKYEVKLYIDNKYCESAYFSVE